MVGEAGKPDKGVERRSHGVGRGQARLRWIAAHLARPILPSRVMGHDQGYEKAAALLSEGYGLIVLMNHFSLRDAPQALSFLARNRVVRQRLFLAPVAYHQYRRYGRLVRLLAGWFAIRLQPIATSRTAQLLGEQQGRARGLRSYLDQAREHLAQGGILLLAPQGGRRNHLGLRRGRPLGRLLSQREGSKSDHLALFFLTLGIEGRQAYSQETAGLNLGQRYEINLGPCLTLNELLRHVSDLQEVDDWVFAQMADLVPAGYRLPPLVDSEANDET